MNTLGQAWREARTRQLAVQPAPVMPAAWQESNLEPAAQGWSA
jgi:hypothetical protein